MFFIKMFKNSFQSFIKTTKKGKLLNFSFVLMGMILALGAICVINFATTDASSFIANLKSNANLRWNICTTADEMVAGSVGNKVFFVMCPTEFAEEE